MHLIAPINFRLGKTFPWKTNVVPSNYTTRLGGGSALSLSIGVEQALGQLLSSHDLFSVRTVARYNPKTIVWNLYVLYAPQMRELPIPPILVNSEAIETWLYSNRLINAHTLAGIKTHFDQVQKKSAALRYKIGPRFVGRWVSRRLFRGSPMVYLRRGTIRTRASKYLVKRLTRQRKQLWIQGRACRLFRPRRHQFVVPSTGLNDRLFGPLLSALIRCKVKVISMNVFTYLVKKGVMSFKNHQRHFWNSAYRGRRWSYANYWDLLNAFYLIGTIKHTEHLLLSLLRRMLSTVAKPRRVFYFLDAVIKNLPQIVTRFSCFRFTIAGKLAGGTKRTRYFTIGYGRLVVNSLSEEASNNFDRFAHRFGEFGLSLIMCRKLPSHVIMSSHNTAVVIFKPKI